MVTAELIDVAEQYLGAGLCALPARRAEKRPAIRGRWEPYKSRLPTAVEVRAWFANAQDGICLVCGSVSGNLEAIDFDLAGELLEPWKQRIQSAAPGLIDKLVIERTPSGGWHVAYRCEADVCGNLKLAQRKRPVVADEIRVGKDGRETIVFCGKEYAVRADADGKYVIVTLIETRGEGGLFLCAPTEGYELVQGDLCAPPVLTAAERDVLLGAAWELNEYVPPVVNGPSSDHARPAQQADRPGDDFNARGDPRGVLQQHGWTLAQGGANEYWRRPGKATGWSATLKDRVFYVFSSNAAPFEPDKAYGPFAVYAHLEHSGDFAAAARALRVQGYGGPAHDDGDVDISGIVVGAPRTDPAEPRIPDPGPLPDELLRVPGFVGQVMDYCLATAPYPNPVMAFCGALALQAFLAGRRVRDPGDNRTNIYLLGLAHSAAGKDWPRKVNTRIVHEVGMSDCLGDRFASGEGVQDALFLNPCMLFQNDEIDGMLQSINKAKDARHENIMGTLLTMYSSSNSVFPMRRKAGKAPPGVIDQPCLVVFGTAIPNHYYEALSERMLTNGFFARMVILEAGRRCKGQEPRIADLPPRVLETARWWADYRPGRGNLQDWHPVPAVVEYAPDAMAALIATREEAEAEYAKAEEGGDPVGTTVWGRVSEQVRKLALLHAVSEKHKAPRIGVDAVRWASRFVLHQTRRMLFMANGHVADSPFHAECLKFIQKLRDAPGTELSHQVMLKRMKLKAKDFKDLVETLMQRGDVVAASVQTAGRTGLAYRLADAVKDG